MGASALQGSIKVKHTYPDFVFAKCGQSYFLVVVREHTQEIREARQTQTFDVFYNRCLRHRLHHVR